MVAILTPIQEYEVIMSKKDLTEEWSSMPLSEEMAAQHRYLRLVGLLFVVLLITACGATSGQVTADSEMIPEASVNNVGESKPVTGFDNDLQRLAGDIITQLPEDKPSRIAVFDFSNIDGRGSACGRMLAQSLEAELVGLAHEKGNFSLVERRSLNLIKEEIKHSLSDLADESQAIEVGKQAGATALLRAAINPWADNQIRVIARVIDVENTKILGACSQNIALPKTLLASCHGQKKTPDQNAQLISAINPDSSYDVKVWTDKAVYRLDETVTIYAQANRAGYLYLFDIDSQGNQTLLLPNIYSKKHYYLEVGQTFVSPNGWFGAGLPTGRGYIKAVVSPRPLPFDRPDFSDLAPNKPFRSITANHSRGVVVKTMETKGGFGTAWLTVEE